MRPVIIAITAAALMICAREARASESADCKLLQRVCSRSRESTARGAASAAGAFEDDATLTQKATLLAITEDAVAAEQAARKIRAKYGRMPACFASACSGVLDPDKFK
jgi:hypothetical protein